MIGLLALLHLLAVATVVIGFGLGQDRLLFASGAPRMLAFSACLALLLWLPLVAAALAWVGLRGREAGARLRAVATRLIAFGVLLGFVVFAVDGLRVALAYLFELNDALPGDGGFWVKAVDLVLEVLENWTAPLYRLDEGPAAVLSFGTIALFATPCVALVRRLPDPDGLQRSLVRLGLCTGVAGIAAVLVLLATGHRDAAPEPGAGTPKRQNLVLLVLDGLGSEYLPIFNPGVEIEGFDALAARSRLFTRVITNRPYTHGFFRVLYSGRRDGVAGDANLYSLLQGAGVHTRWVSAHNNGVPDTHGVRYRGLRSALLSQNFAWTAAWFGLDYNVLRHDDFRSRGTPLGERELYLSTLVNLPFPDRHPLDDTLIQQLRDLHAGPEPFFLMLLTSKRPGEPPVRRRNPFAADDHPQAATLFELDDADNVYPEALQPTVDTWRAQREEVIVPAAVGALARVFETFEREGWWRNTRVLVTADHGYMYTRGKLGYHYHPDEEAVRVPVLLAGEGLSGRDSRPFETVDLSETVLDHFGVAETLSPDARSLLDGAASKRRLTSLTEHSDVRDEWLLAVYEGGVKYVVDLLGRQPTTAYRVEGFAAQPLPGPPEAAPRLDLAELIRSHGAGQRIEELAARR